MPQINHVSRVETKVFSTEYLVYNKVDWQGEFTLTFLVSVYVIRLTYSHTSSSFQNSNLTPI